MKIGTNFKLEFCIYYNDELIGQFLTEKYLKFIASKKGNMFDFNEGPSAWKIKSNIYNSYSLSDCMENFMIESNLSLFLLLNNDVIKNLQKTIFIKVDIVFGDTMPGLHLTQKSIDFLSQVSSNLDIDLYDLRKENFF